MKQDRSLLEQNLIKPTLEVKRRRGVVKDVKTYLSDKHAIFGGSVQTWVNNPAEELKGIDTRLLFLFSEQIYQKTGNPSINPADFFTDAEIKKSKQYSGKMYIEEEMKFPLTFNYALKNSRDVWVVMMNIRTVVSLLKSRKLNWNPESQREATYKVVNGDIIEEATLYMENVNDMKILLKKNELEQTEIILNASLGTSNSGEEVIFDDVSHQLKITDGTLIDIVDGYHRIKAAEFALSESPDIEFEFQVKILNKTVDSAANYLAQISKGERMSETKRKSMSKESNAYIIVKDLREKSILRDRISKKEMLTKIRKELVTFNTLSSSIDKNFDISRSVDRYRVFDYLKEFFEALLGYYENEFTTNYADTKQKSLISDNNMFAGYIILASRMMYQNIEAREVKKYIDQIDFSKNNTLWKQLDILDDKERLTRNAKSGIEKYFTEIKL